MKTYLIAMTESGHLVATASTMELLRERAEREIAEARWDDLSFDDLHVEDGLTLHMDEDNVPPEAEIVYSGTAMGWLEDDDGNMVYEVAAR